MVKYRKRVENSCSHVPKRTAPVGGARCSEHVFADTCSIEWVNCCPEDILVWLSSIKINKHWWSFFFSKFFTNYQWEFSCYSFDKVTVHITWTSIDDFYQESYSWFSCSLCIQQAGGVRSSVVGDGMTRGPAVRFPSAIRARYVQPNLTCWSLLAGSNSHKYRS